MTDRDRARAAQELRDWADDADQHGNKYVPVSPGTLRKIAAALEAMAQDNVAGGGKGAESIPASNAPETRAPGSPAPLTQPAQPVAWWEWDGAEGGERCIYWRGTEIFDHITQFQTNRHGESIWPLYAAPQAGQWLAIL